MSANATTPAGGRAWKPPAPPALPDQAGFARAFAEWKRRYDESPESFVAEWASLAPGDYGDQAAEYFVRLLIETRLS